MLIGRHYYHSQSTDEETKAQDCTAGTDSRTLALITVLLYPSHWAYGETEAQRTAGTFPNQSANKPRVRIRTLLSEFLQRTRLSQHLYRPSGGLLQTLPSLESIWARFPLP